MPPLARAAILDRLNDELDPAWRRLARPEQLPPAGDWGIWYVRGGRGSGKTWTGGHTFAEWLRHPGEYAIVAPTFADARDTNVEGPSGILAALGLPRQFRQWNRSQGQMWLPSGAVVFIDGADDGAYRIQGKNLRGLWADEIGLWKKWAQAWDESIAFAVRHDPARIVASGTPKRGHPLVKRLLNDPDVITSLLRTLDNKANLSPIALARLVKRYGGTELGRQELGGELLEEAAGALWTRSDSPAPGKGILTYGEVPTQINLRNGKREPDLPSAIVAVDPAVSSAEESNETGIIGAALGGDGKGYVLADRSCRLGPGPNGWPGRAIALYRDIEADAIVAEANQGGEMVRQVLKAVDPNVPVRLVHASRGKRTRAEPVAALYEKLMVIHVDVFTELEDQLVSWEPGVTDSPDRLDALVWGLTYLMLTGAGETAGTSDLDIYAE